MTCDCEPIVHDDGSRTHEQDCAIYPWCPHEVAAYACLMPCCCGCGACNALSDAHTTPAPSRRPDPHPHKGETDE